VSEPLEVGPGRVIPGDDLAWRAVRASGPGGQNVNKVSSRVELRLNLTTRALDDDTRARLRVLARRRIDSEGRLLVTSSLTRDQAKNLADAREKLRALVMQASVKPKPRRPTRPTRGATERRISEKKRHAARKKARGRLAED
jgi:ribosome-associated protein